MGSVRTRRVLLLGGTGAMGSHLTCLLAHDGWDVTVTSRSERSSDDSNVTYVRGNAHDPAFLGETLSRGWDVVVDFMVWSTRAFRDVRDSLLGSCQQYVFLSSYRVFADSPVIDERSPRLLDVSDDAGYLATDEYALAKARQEDLLRASERGNWTIVRPAITYSTGRLQLCTMECGEWLTMALAGHAVPLPTEVLARQTTMTWGGDVALMLSRLIGSKGALSEDYDVCTSQHRSWASVVEIYRSLLSFEVQRVTSGAYEWACGSPWQCRYDRMYDRVMDNSKVLAATGLSESDLTDLADGLVVAVRDTLRKGIPAPAGMRRLGRLDRLGGGFIGPVAFSRLPDASAIGYAKYLAGRTLG